MKPRLSSIRTIAETTARVDMVSTSQRGQEFEHAWPSKPRISWEAKQRLLFWIDPPARALSTVRKYVPGSAAADAYAAWEGVDPKTEQDFALPSAPLKAAGRPVRIHYEFKRFARVEWWHHDFDDDDRFYVSSNTRGARLFVVTGPRLEFTDRGIIN